MKKNTMYILGGVAVVGLAYYLYNRNKQSTIEVTLPGFANATGTTSTTTKPSSLGSGACGGCGSGFRWTQAVVYNSQYGTYNIENVCVACTGTSK